MTLIIQLVMMVVPLVIGAIAQGFEGRRDVLARRAEHRAPQARPQGRQAADMIGVVVRH